MNSRTLTLVLIILGLLLAALLTRLGDLAWMALPFLVYLGIGIWLAPESSDLNLQAERQVTRTTPEDSDLNGAVTIEVQVHVRNLGASIGRLYLCDALPDDVSVSDGHTSRWSVLPQGGEDFLRYTFQTRRGAYTWKTIQAVASDPFGLVETSLELPAAGKIEVHPETLRYQRLGLRPNSTLHSPGSIPARRSGSGIDFWGVREYHPGDSLRKLDWRRSARYPHQIFTKEFEQEEVADIGLIVDARQRAYLQVDDDRLFEHALGAAASLAETFSHQGHRLSLLGINDRLVQVSPGYGKVQLYRILRCLARLQTGDNTGLNGLYHIPLRMFSSHALLVVISPLVSGDRSFFPRLRAYGFQALLVSPDPFEFAARTIPQDRLSQLAYRAARLKRRIELAEVSRLAIPVIDWPVSQPLYPYLLNALTPGRGNLRG